MDYLDRIREIKENRDGNEMEELGEIMNELEDTFGGDTLWSTIRPMLSVDDLEYYLEEIIKDLDC